MAQDVDQAAQGVRDQRMQDEIDDFVDWHEGGGRMFRGVRRGGERTEVWMSDRKEHESV
jgi:hypothetical protein